MHITFTEIIIVIILIPMISLVMTILDDLVKEYLLERKMRKIMKRIQRTKGSKKITIPYDKERWLNDRSKWN